MIRSQLESTCKINVWDKCSASSCRRRQIVDLLNILKVLNKELLCNGLESPMFGFGDGKCAFAERKTNKDKLNVLKTYWF